MLLGSRIGTSAHDLPLSLLQRGQNDDAALAAEAATVGPLLLPSLGVTCAGLARNQAAVLRFGAAGHCRAPQSTPNPAGQAPCDQSSINEAYYNLDKVFA
ncbi:hypothetical protein ZHAS_00021665 [Anopheles sinensis]|uniref:Uncharacterized protein n=1 Tax=Anopheles sinensis TaxID=74873 RepID=A0A084WT12_ANOSI|nr:hypothetical protein ZHAS_00021665 [Anopheles sinensis]